MIHYKNEGFDKQEVRPDRPDGGARTSPRFPQEFFRRVKDKM